MEDEVDYQIIKQPSSGVIKMLENRSNMKDFVKQGSFDTIGLVQGKLVEMLVAADIAEKTADVNVMEVKGVCPQHFTMITIFGDTAAVTEAVERIKEHFEKG